MPKIITDCNFNKDLRERIYFVLPGLTDSEIGDILKVKRQSIQGWKSGKSRPTLDHIRIISSITKICWQWFATGTTTNYNSVAFAYFPIYFKKSTIKNNVAYEKLREITAILLATTNDRKFLPMVSILFEVSKGNIDIALNITKSTPIHTIITFLQGTIIDRVKNEEIVSLYKSMLESYTPIEQHMNNDVYMHTSDQSIQQNCPFDRINPDILAYTNFSEQLPCTSNIDPTHDNINQSPRVRVIGNSMTPVVLNNQIAVTGRPINISELSSKTPIIAIIKLYLNHDNNTTASTKQPILLCKYVLRIEDRVALTSTDTQSSLMLVNLRDICYIKPISALLF